MMSGGIRKRGSDSAKTEIGETNLRARPPSVVVRVWSPDADAHLIDKGIHTARSGEV
jgi:hypothetical protein